MVFDFNMFPGLGKNPEKQIVRILSIFHAILMIPLPLVFYMSPISTAQKVLSLALLVVIAIVSTLFFKSRGLNKLQDAFECGLYGLILLTISFANNHSLYILVLMHINIAVFSLMLTLRYSLVLSSFQAVAYIFEKILYSGFESWLIDGYTVSLIFTGVIMGLISDILRSSFEKSRLLEDLHFDTMKAFVEAIEAKDKYTCGHSIKVSYYSKLLARRLGLEEKEIENIERAALLHDIGKIGVSDRILNKSGPLTDEEFERIKEHPLTGVKILSNVRNITDILPAIQGHHERIDGRGYPDGLKDDEIPLDARILCIADSYEAMTSDRPYRKALGRDEALKRLRTGKGSQFSAELVELFIDIVNDIKELPDTSQSVLRPPAARLPRRKTLSCA